MRRLLLCLPLCLLGPVLPHATPVILAAEPLAAAEGKGPLPKPAEMERLAKEDPIAFLEQCLRHYDRTVKGYTLVMQKQERLDDKLNPKEVIDVCFRDQPHSVLMRWLENPRLAGAALYVEGENDGKLLVRPAGLIGRRLIVEREPDGPEAKRSGRVTLPEYGLKKAMERTLKSWKAARDKDELHVEFLEEVKLKEAGDRPCFCLRRSRYARPEADGVTELTVFIDKENWLQVGSILKGEDGKLIAEYYFRDIKLNPEFKAEQFKRDALKP